MATGYRAERERRRSHCHAERQRHAEIAEPQRIEVATGLCRQYRTTTTAQHQPEGAEGFGRALFDQTLHIPPLIECIAQMPQCKSRCRPAMGAAIERSGCADLHATNRRSCAPGTGTSVVLAGHVDVMQFALHIPRQHGRAHATFRIHRELCLAAFSEHPPDCCGLPRSSHGVYALRRK